MGSRNKTVIFMVWVYNSGGGAVYLGEGEIIYMVGVKDSPLFGQFMGGGGIVLWVGGITFMMGVEGSWWWWAVQGWGVVDEVGG